jgi:hypothetical protein
LASAVAQAYFASREALGFPMLSAATAGSAGAGANATDTGTGKQAAGAQA